MRNEYIPFLSEIKEVIRHTPIEYTFRMAYKGTVKPGQFFEVSIPKYGEAPISVSGIGDGYVDLTIRRVGKVTNEIFENREIVIMAGGTGLSPVKGIVDYFADHPQEHSGMTLIAGFKTPNDILFLKEFAKWKRAMDVILTVDCAEGDTACQIGLVTEYIPELKVKDIRNAVAVVVGPPMMMRFSVQGLLERGFAEKNIWISQERKMCCGLGKCGHCKIGDRYVCLDGPVFNYTEGKNLID